MRLINADLLKAKAYPGYHTPGEVDPLVVELSDIDDAPTIFAIPTPVKCGECVYWEDRKIRTSDGEERDYMPNEPESVTLDVGINVGSHCTRHGFENESGSWFWANAEDFCSRGKRKDEFENEKML